MDDDLANHIRTGFAQLSQREVLQSPPTVLLGVSDEAGALLAGLGLATVFDLGLSPLFDAARRLVAGAAGEDPILATGLVPAGLVDGGTDVELDAIANKPVLVLAGIDEARALQIRSSMHVETVRDLALWPPYRAAAAIVDRTLNPDPPHPDSEAPSDLVPATGRYPTDRIFYNAHVLVPPHADDRPDVRCRRRSQQGDRRAPTQDQGPRDLGPRRSVGFAADADHTEARRGPDLRPELVPGRDGARPTPVLATTRSGESTKLAVVDWRRRTNASLDEAVSQTESLTNTMTQSRAVAEVASAVVKEVQSGTSEITTDATSGSIGAGGGAVLGGPALVGGTAAASASSATTTGVFTSTGERGVTAEMQQFVSDATHQQAFSSRNRHAATVSEAYAEERESISTRTVSNYNHMHAMTVQYYEVVQLYRTMLRLASVKRVLFVPFALLDFDDEQVILRTSPSVGARDGGSLRPRPPAPCLGCGDRVARPPPPPDLRRRSRGHQEGTTAGGQVGREAERAR